MSKQIMILIMVIFGAVPALASSTIGELGFATNFDSLLAQAQESQRLMVIKFYTDW